MLGPASTGWPRRPGPDAVPRRRACLGWATSPSAGGAPPFLHSDATRTRRPAARHGEAGRPRWVRPGRGWPDTNTRATRTSRRERAAARVTNSHHAKTCPVTRPKNYPCRRLEGVLYWGLGRARPPRRDAIKAWSRAGRRRPEAAHMPERDCHHS